jgi:hypothetical protein
MFYIIIRNALHYYAEWKLYGKIILLELLVWRSITKIFYYLLKKFLRKVSANISNHISEKFGEKFLDCSSDVNIGIHGYV